MGKRCVVCGTAAGPLFQFPSDTETFCKWFQAVADVIDTSRIKKRTVLCKNHFTINCFSTSTTKCRLLPGAVPSVFNISCDSEQVIGEPLQHTIPCNPVETCSISIQVDSISSRDYSNLQNSYKMLSEQFKAMTKKYLKCLSKVQQLEDEKKENSKNLTLINKVVENAQDNDEKATFIMDVIQNYSRKTPRWSDMSIRMCTIWRFCSPKGYEYCRNHLVKLPSRSTIARFVGTSSGTNELIKSRLRTEIDALKLPVERICSLIIDDMAIKEKIHYSRLEDRVYGLDNCTSEIVSEQPKIANKMLCYVIHGLSTRYTVPAGYFFHQTLSAKNFHLLTMNVLQVLTDCGFIVVRIVTDNHASNVKLFKTLGNGSLENVISHPTLQKIPLFLSFDYCHVLKNARNILLDHDMCSMEGTISGSHLKNLYHLQKDLPVKPVKHLTQKHLYPTNFEKMSVIRALQIFTPAVTSALQFLKEHRHNQFYNVDATVSFMQNMYHFFQVHNVDSRSQYIRSLDSSIAPYINVSDERMHWLNITFQNYIDEIQSCSATEGMQGLTHETAHALKFTARSTYLCIRFLLQDVGFYYVLTRSFSSDAVEATFSHVRLRCGSNDAVDARGADYAMRQILKCGIVKASTSANTLDNVDFISSTQLHSNSNPTASTSSSCDIEDGLLPMEIKLNLQYLQTDCLIRDDSIYSASVAFLAGYIIKKLEENLQCNVCLTPLHSDAMPDPFLKLIALQDRGGLMYPSGKFVGIVKQIANLVSQILPYLNHSNICTQVTNIIFPYLKENPIFQCTLHKEDICQIIITSAVKPILSNICLEKTDTIKKRTINFKPTSRKIFKL